MRRNEPGSAPVLAWHLTGAIAAWFAFPAVQCAVLNASARLIRAAWVHVSGYLAFVGVHVAVMLSLRALFGVQAPQPLTSQIAWEAQADLILYAGLAAGWSLLRANHERQQRELAAARIASQLAEARLAALSAQLDPHFLFNALNAVGACMYEDLPRTERLLENISQLLRESLECRSPTWPLARERAHTERYLDVLAARFGAERLEVSWHLAEPTTSLLVPRFAVQSLVENAVKHNRARRERLSVRIESLIEAGHVSLTVEDDGLGFPSRFEPPPQHGLERLRETLHLLFGPAARLELTARAPSGARITMALPGAPS
jgi:LytS/YehU family sensor histidine kinase